MRYAILTNPVSGSMTVDQKRRALAPAAEILDARIYGLDSGRTAELVQCARQLVNTCDVLVAAGGDGTFSDIINAIDTSRTPVAYLPLGTGNALHHAFSYRGKLADIAARIRRAQVRAYDLIDCDGKKRAVMASTGIDATIIRLRDAYRMRGISGFNAYMRGTLAAYFREYERVSAEVVVDGAAFEVRNLLSLMVVKQPFFGFGMKVVPNARFDGGQLHVLWINSGLLKFALGGLAAFTMGNRVGIYRPCRHVEVRLERPLALQIDGDSAWEASAFNFTVLPGALRIKC